MINLIISQQTKQLIEIANDIVKQTDKFHNVAITNIDEDYIKLLDAVCDNVFTSGNEFAEKLFTEIGNHIARNIKNTILQNKEVEQLYL